MFKMIAKEIAVDMYIGICDFEHTKKQKVLVNVIAYGHPSFSPTDISQCLDYSSICTFVQNWTDREHVDLVETLLVEVMDFLFKDKRIYKVDVEVLKPEVIKDTQYVGVGAVMTREEFKNQLY